MALIIADDMYSFVNDCNKKARTSLIDILACYM